MRTGWLAGAIHGVWCHCSGTSKPCLRVLLGEHSKCDGCDDKRRAAWVGYVPLRRNDGRPFVVAIREATAAVADRLVPGARVRWFRREGRGESVQLHEEERGQLWERFYPNLLARADLTAWLCRLWRMPHIANALTIWFSQESSPTPTAVVDVTPSPTEEPLPTWVGKVQDEGAKLVGAETYDQLRNRIMNKAQDQAAAPNGKHKKPKP